MVPTPFLFDLHQDLALYFYSGEGYGYESDSFEKDLPNRQADLPKFRRGNVKLVVSSVFPLMRTLDPEIADLLTRGYGGLNSAFSSTSSTLVAQHLIKIYYQLQSQFGGRIKIVKTQADLRSILSEPEKTGFLLALEGTESVSDPSDLEIFRRLGIRSLQFTWNFDTKYASSCMSEKDYGLTGAGMRLLRLANEQGIILDLAHAGKNTCLEVLKQAKLPVLISHANVAGVFKHSRNIDDSVLDALKLNGGVIGLTLIPDTYGKPHPDVKDLVQHILHVRDNFGKEILAIGTDYFGLFPPDQPPSGLEDISKFANLWYELRANGFTQEEIEAISFRNALRVIEANAKNWEI
ncbi:MAG: membrane dipeptidase [Thaumarchaeota archaeon]|nr:membrane dipeptidase [Nitrososphaerota archaeon]